MGEAHSESERKPASRTLFKTLAGASPVNKRWATVLTMEPLVSLGQPTGGTGEQAELFPIEGFDSPRTGQGFRGPAVCQIVGLTYRQLDY
jgi:hypothetical protein